MSVFKPFITSDVVVSPFEVNKSFTFQGTASFSQPNVSIERHIGKNITASLWTSGSYPTGISTIQDQQLVYRSIRELYYTNFLKDPKGSPASTASFYSNDFVPDLSTAIELDNQYPSSNYNVIFGERDTTNYYNYLSNTLPPNRVFPTSSDALIGVFSIPSNLFGEYIKPGSFSLKTTYSTITDDFNGNLLFNDSFTEDYHVGNIIYEHGMIILNAELLSTIQGYGYVTYGTSSFPYPVGIYGGIFGTLFTSDDITCSFQSTTTIYESQYKCTIRQNEFNFSQNPTIIGPPDQGYDVSYYNDILTYNDDAIYDGYDLCNPIINSNIYSWATGSYFNPYVTTIGLYNNNYELIAVAKLAQPLPLSSITDTTILVNLDL